MSVGQDSAGPPATAGAQSSAGVTYTQVDASYFEARRLKRYARVWSLWALGVGAVISGHYSGWNLGRRQRLRLHVPGRRSSSPSCISASTFSLAEMSPALPHTGGAYSFARTSMGPWAGYITGIAENIEFVLTPAVIVFFIGSYLSAIFDTDPVSSRSTGSAAYVVFVGLNIVGVELSFRVTVIVTLLALAMPRGLLRVGDLLGPVRLLPLGAQHRARTASELPEGGGAFLPLGIAGIFASTALRGLALPRHRATAARRGGIARSAARHAEGHHRRHPDPDRVGVPGASSSTPASRRARSGSANPPSRCSTASATLFGSDIAKVLAARRGDRADRLLPHDHLRLRPADLLALAGRLLPGLPVDHPRHAQDRRTWR